MINPYDPTGSATEETPTPKKVHFYSDGLPAIAALSLVIGAIVGGSIFSAKGKSELSFFGIPALGWVIVLCMLSLLIRNSKMSILGRLLLALILSIPAYILYVPVCIGVSITTMPIMGVEQYSPKMQGVVFGSAVAFFVVLVAIAAVVRVVIRKRAGAQLNQINEQN